MLTASSAGAMQQAGLRVWLSKLEPRLASSIHFALCLDGLGNSAAAGSDPSQLCVWLCVCREEVCVCAVRDVCAADSCT